MLNIQPAKIFLKAMHDLLASFSVILCQLCQAGALVQSSPLTVQGTERITLTFGTVFPVKEVA